MSNSELPEGVRACSASMRWLCMTLYLPGAISYLFILVRQHESYKPDSILTAYPFPRRSVIFSGITYSKGERGKRLWDF
jgi:hypothetical protein